jgi:hypothetical protein
MQKTKQVFCAYEGKVVLVPFFLNEHHAMKAYWGSGNIAPRILDLAARCIFAYKGLY